MVFDSGVRTGADVVKAVALGADAVAVGRPYVYGLALGGVPGAVHRHQVALQADEADRACVMAVDGYRDPSARDSSPPDPALVRQQ